MSTAVATLPQQQQVISADIEKVLIGGDLSKLTAEQRVSYYGSVCKSLGLNPLTKPFAYLTLNNKMVLYAQKDCTEQLRTLHNISLTIPAREAIEGVYVVTARAQRVDGRHDESTGAVAIEGLKGEAKANAMMKAETKAKRRVTLSICGLGIMDESEVESVPGAQVHPVVATEPAKIMVTVAEGDTREVPEELLGIFERLNEKGGVETGIKMVKRLMAENLGADLADATYDKLLKQWNIQPKGNKTASIQGLLLDMFDAAGPQRKTHELEELPVGA